MKRVFQVALAIYAIGVSAVFASSEVYIATDGSDRNDGSLKKPVKTIAHAMSLGSDRIYLRGGVYRFDEVIANSDREVTIAAYKDERVVISGTEAITTKWREYRDNIYVTKPNVEAWQIFVDGEMMNAARTPNIEGYIEDKQPVSMFTKSNSVWDIKRSWYKGNKSSTVGNMVVDDDRFLEQKQPLEGGIAILNIGSWKTSYADITSYNVGDNHFGYNTEMVKPFISFYKFHISALYFEGLLSMLDAPGEWFYDTKTKSLYLYCKDGSAPKDRVEGKTQSYALKLLNSHNITISNIEFRATTICCEKSSNIKVDGCEFYYPSYSKRMLRGKPELIDVTLFNDCLGVEFSNNVVKYSEGEAVVFMSAKSQLKSEELAMMKRVNPKREYNPNNSSKSLIPHYTRHIVRNNLMENIDFSCVNIRSIGASVVLFGRGCEFSHNTIAVAGASEALISDAEATIEYNEVYSTGHLQHDGAIFQMMAPGSMFSSVRGNWLHDTVKLGMRVDTNEGYKGEEWRVGDNMTSASFVNNTLWNCGGMQIKGDYHLVVNNTLVGSYPPDDFAVPVELRKDEWPTAISIAKVPWMGMESGNGNTYCFNNLTELTSTWFKDRQRYMRNAYPLPEHVVNNYIGYYGDKNHVDKMVMDYANRDFRPIDDEQIVDAGIDPTLPAELKGVFDYQRATVSDPLDIGAYAYNDPEYTIPGYRTDSSSSPIPADGSLSVASEIMLAWRPAWGASSSKIYFGVDRKAVEHATTQAVEFKGESSASCYYPTVGEYPLNQSKERYFWRVDCIVDGEVIKGKVWEFTRSEN